MQVVLTAFSYGYMDISMWIWIDMDFQQWFEFMDSGCKKVFKVLITMGENESSKCSAHVQYMPLTVCSGFVKLHHNELFYIFSVNFIRVVVILELHPTEY